MTHTRREFIALAGAAVGTSIAGAAAWGATHRNGGPPAAAPTTAPEPGSTTTAGSAPAPAPTGPTVAPTSTTAVPRPPATGRVLVVVQLGGGNDGLNTLVPLQGRYHDARRTIGLPDDGLVPFPGTEGYGLHPAMKPLTALLAAGQVAAYEAIGYPHPNRSHFAALDDWWSATPGQSSTTGWLGRWLDATGAAGADPLRAVALGSGAPALLGDRSRPTVVLSPQAFTLHTPKGLTDQLARPVAAAGGDLAARYRTAVADATSAVATFAALKADAANDPAEPGGEGADGAIAKGLATAAQLVLHEPTTRVVQVAVGGFDTHAGQLATQERLLGDLAAGVSSFFAELTKAGQAERVLLVTVSEFGRRVAENGSGGTDHGKASVQFAAGPAVRGGLYGQADLGALDDGDLAPQLDVRSLYAAALTWLGGPVDEVLGGRYDTLGMLRS